MGEAVTYPQGRVGVGDTSDEDEGAVTLKKTHAEHELPVCEKPKLPRHSENHPCLLHFWIFWDIGKYSRFKNH